MEGNLTTIGRHTIVDLPEWEYAGIEAKVDTGAYTSSLHCHRTEIFRKGEDGKERVRIWLLDPSYDRYRDKPLEVPVNRRKTVRSSNGVSEERLFVKTIVRMFRLEIPTEFSLTDRTGMKYPILIGRKVLKGRFLVDVSRTGRQKS